MQFINVRMGMCNGKGIGSVYYGWCLASLPPYWGRNSGQKKKNTFSVDENKQNKKQENCSFCSNFEKLVKY